jgi:DNA ligase (NAD+)
MVDFKAKLEKKIKADKAYEAGKEIMTDQEYDQEYGVNASALVVPDISPWKKHKHDIQMPSLFKVNVITPENKINLSDVHVWLEKHASKQYTVSPKYDGTAIKIYYENGKLVRAVTRGDGNIGEDCTRNVLKARNVLPEISDVYVREVLGEVVLPRSTFKKHLTEIYANPRNGAAGALKDFKGKHAKHLSIRYYGVISEDVSLDSEIKKFRLLKTLGFKAVQFAVVANYDELRAYYLKLHKGRFEADYDTDGVVIKVNRASLQQKMGYRPDGKAKYACAIKFPYIQKTTIVKEIEWSLGNSGNFTPVAIVKKVDLGVDVRRVSLANLDIMKGLQISIGDEVVVSRRGDVIPKIEKNNTKHENWTLDYPVKCSVCKESTIIDGPQLLCSSPTCPSRYLGDLYKWSAKIKDHFKVKGLGPERIYQMYQAGLIKTPADLYKLKPEQLIGKIEGVKEAAAENILEFQKHTKIPLDLFMSALNIPHIGQSIFAFLISAGYDTLEKMLKMSHYELAAVDNLGDIRANLILTWMKKKSDVIKSLLEHLELEKPKAPKTGKLNGQTFLITGTLSKPRHEIEGMITDKGGKIASGVSKNLNYLVCGEKAGSKLEKAQKLEVAILNEEQLIGMLG